jgi:hypothetical protein
MSGRRLKGRPSTRWIDKLREMQTEENKHRGCWMKCKKGQKTTFGDSYTKVDPQLWKLLKEETEDSFIAV